MAFAILPILANFIELFQMASMQYSNWRNKHPVPKIIKIIHIPNRLHKPYDDTQLKSIFLYPCLETTVVFRDYCKTMF